ncbi:MAG: hypothetical protein IJP17_04835, partial [Clostridia bacterium]|nr:hypothetical protein [Clostridia bacterium]
MKSLNQNSRNGSQNNFLDTVIRFTKASWNWFKYVVTLLGVKVLDYFDALSEQREQRERQREARDRRKSATGSVYDGDYSRRKKAKPKWLVITQSIITFLMRGLATLLLVCVITGCIVGAASMVYILVYLDKDIEFDLHQLKLSYTSTIYVEN